MAEGEVTLTIRCNTFFFRAWVEVYRILLLFGLLTEERAVDLAYSGRWLVLLKIGGDHWRLLRG